MDLDSDGGVFEPLGHNFWDLVIPEINSFPPL